MQLAKEMLRVSAKGRRLRVFAHGRSGIGSAEWLCFVNEFSYTNSLGGGSMGRGAQHKKRSLWVKDTQHV